MKDQNPVDVTSCFDCQSPLDYFGSFWFGGYMEAGGVFLIVNTLVSTTNPVLINRLQAFSFACSTVLFD